MPLEQLFAGRSVDVQAIAQKLNKAAADEGLPFRRTDRICNSRLAQELGLWAESEGKGDELHLAIFKAYFADGKNIGQIPVLVELASSIGLSGDHAYEILKARAFKSAVDADWEFSREMRITAVPTFILNQDRLVGAYPYEAFEELMKSNGVKKR